MSTMTEVQRDKLVTDLKNVIHDAEELLRLSASEMGAEATAMQDRVRQRVLQAKDSLLQLQETAVERAKAVGRQTDDYVHDNPWTAIGIAAGVGLLAGLLIGRR
jgi:ElaB/YqjD/DUF883 family membrane-anchored ribosome-binding protein